MRNSDYISVLRDAFEALFGYDGVVIPLLLLSFFFIAGWALAVKIFAYFVNPTRRKDK